MGTITRTLIVGLTDKMVQARLNSVDAKPFLFGTYFPVTKVNGFTWRTLTDQLAHRNVAADIHTDNGTVLRKRRPIFESAIGDMPYISISRDLKRSEIKEYQTALALATDQSAAALVQYWGNDVDFCFTGVQAELEYIAWKLFSNAGKLAFTTTTNATFANEFDLDYDVYDEEKLTADSDWTKPSSADILGDLRTLIFKAKALGMNPKFAFVNLNQLYRICSSEQIIKACASYISNAVGMSQTPDLAAVNAMLLKQAWLNKLQLRVIDTEVTREFQDGTSWYGNPFDDNRIILTETERLGSTQYDLLQEQNDNIIRVERSHTVVKKYSEVEPLKEVTIGEADAVPVFDTAYRSLYVKTDKTDWE